MSEQEFYRENIAINSAELSSLLELIEIEEDRSENEKRFNKQVTLLLNQLIEVLAKEL